MERTDFELALRGVSPVILFEKTYCGAVDAHYGVRTIATYFPMTHDARMYTDEDGYQYETFDNATDLEDAVRWFIDNTPDEWFNDSDYVLDLIERSHEND